MTMIFDGQLTMYVSDNENRLRSDKLSRIVLDKYDRYQGGATGLCREHPPALRCGMLDMCYEWWLGGKVYMII